MVAILSNEIVPNIQDGIPRVPHFWLFLVQSVVRERVQKWEHQKSVQFSDEFLTPAGVIRVTSLFHESVCVESDAALVHDKSARDKACFVNKSSLLPNQRLI